MKNSVKNSNVKANNISKFSNVALDTKQTKAVKGGADAGSYVIIEEVING